MTEKESKREYYNSAMYYGTLLGAVWAVMYLLVFAGATNIMCAMTAIVLYAGSPFIAGWFATRYRKEECNNEMQYSNAWLFLVIIYICATTIGTIVNYIYINHIDHGGFIGEMQEMLSAIQGTPGATADIVAASESYRELLSRIDTTALPWQIMESDCLNSFLLPPIIALFVKKGKQI